jgi:CubicO group peptidase (beta-lactamase class C family)
MFLSGKITGQNRFRKIKVFVLAALTATLFSSSKIQSDRIPVLTTDNPVGILDTVRINNLNSGIVNGDYGHVRTLLIFKNDSLIFDRYYHHKKDRYKPTDVHGLQSATKSITSLLVGILLDKGYIQSIDQKVLTFFPEYKITDSLKNLITIKDLLLMASGISWNEDKVDLTDAKSNDLRILNSSKDYIKYYFGKPMDSIPGKKFQYSGGCTITLGEIIKRSSGLTVEEFALQYLFKPLGISEYTWSDKSKAGQSSTGGGLSLVPSDFAKIGLLVKNNGRWNNKQVISENWIKESFTPQIHTDRKNGFGNYYEYGYQWWIINFPNELVTIAARGWGDQRLILIPKLNMLVVVNGGNFFDKPKKNIDDLLLEILKSDPAYNP